MRASINHLPSEILSQILLGLRDNVMPFPILGHYSDGDCDPPPTGLWHRASLVCRRWRQEVLGTPGLWTTIRVNDDSASVYRWATVWLSRSGTLSLTVMFDTPLKYRRIDREDVVLILSEGHRIGALCFYAFIGRKTLKTILDHVTGHLETLYVPADDNQEIGSLPCELPWLQTLVVTDGSVWPTWSMRGLRHLILNCLCRHWKLDDLHGFLTLLAETTCLEELMLCSISLDVNMARRNQIIPYAERYSPIHLPALRRLFVQEQITFYEQYPMAEILNRTLELSPACTRVYVLDNGAQGGAHYYPVRQLVVGTSGAFIGTDGVSTCIIDRNNRNAGPRPAIPAIPAIDCDQVQELWLHIPAIAADIVSGDIPPSFLATLRAMRNVTKLVLHRKPSIWLEQLEESFPALEELHILIQHHCDRTAILRFLDHRKRNGLQVDTVRFVGDPTSEDGEAFDSWRGSPSQFGWLVNRLTFEIAHSPSASRYESLVSERLGLPEACKHPSSTSMMWQSWDTYVSLD